MRTYGAALWEGDTGEMARFAFEQNVLVIEIEY